MRFSQHFRMSLTRRGEKELRLGAFIAHGLRDLVPELPGQCTESQATERAILVVARSAQSPVVKSIAALGHEIATARCRVRMILARADRSGLADAFIAAQAAALECDVRCVRNPRLIEAHEQLVLGRRASWTGDSMRRDPATCDAYESFAEDCPEMAAAARATFERLWRDGEPVAEPAPIAAAALGAPNAIPPGGLLAHRR
ncbi:MAG TPA: hypothetical protein VGF29_11835 [Hyphomicrobiaceae bacterium]